MSISTKPPLAITMLLHAHCERSPFPNYTAPAQTYFRKKLVNLGLIEDDGHGIMKTTERGDAWCEMICSTSLPQTQEVLTHVLMRIISK